MKNSSHQTTLTKIAARAARHLTTAALLLTAGLVALPRPIGAQTPTLTVLHDFTRLDGSNPTNGLLLASDGNFYGTTPFGGPGTFDGADYGTVFRITPAGVFTNLVNFTSDNGPIHMRLPSKEAMAICMALPQAAAPWTYQKWDRL